MKRRMRTLQAAVLLVGALAVLLVAWFASGWADVRAQQRELREAPRRAATAQAIELAHALRAELTRLVGREVERPYFHYQNLFHDPRSGGNWSVAPSPLADGPDDPLIAGYFQLDDKGRLTTPTLNDEVPSLSAPGAGQFRDAVLAGFGARLEPLVQDAPLVAAAEPPAPPPPRPQPRPETSRPVERNVPQVVQIDPNSYVQNSMPARVFAEQNASPPPPRAKPRVVAETSVVELPKAPVTITISPLAWHTFPFAGAPALVAVRNVATPDGKMAQGFVVSRAALASWLAARTDAADAALVTGDAPDAAEVAPGWHVEVVPTAATLAMAATDAAAVARGFTLRFVAVGLVAFALAAFVVLVVARAERLASERSQFAAAAAHELRTPLAGLQLYGDMLADGLGDPGKLRDYARRMSEEASRLGRVVSNVLGFSQLERGNLSVDVRRGALGPALCELAERVQPSLDRAGAALEVDVPHELEARFDRDALARIVGNLLDNAEKYSRGAEDRTITLSARATEGGAEVSVRDRGAGVPEAARGRLFRPFSRGVDGDGPAGLGLGLALSQSLARAMGGDLDYRAGDGSTFVLRLPA